MLTARSLHNRLLWRERSKPFRGGAAKSVQTVGAGDHEIAGGVGGNTFETDGTDFYVSDRPGTRTAGSRGINDRRGTAGAEAERRWHTAKTVWCQRCNIRRAAQ